LQSRLFFRRHFLLKMFPFCFHTKLVRNFGCVIESINGLAITARNEMAIDIDCDVNDEWPHLLLHIGKTLPLLNEQARKRVPQKMEIARQTWK